MDKIFGMFKVKAPLTIIGVIVVGVICSAIYDAVVKPGFNIVSDFFFKLLTFGSQQAKDFAFTNAALDPSTMPSMLLMIIVVVVGLTGLILGSLSLNESTKADDALLPRYGDNEEVLAKKKIARKLVLVEIRKKLRVWKTILWVCNIGAVATFFVVLTTTNQAILVWRVHNANVQIISPYLSQSQSLNIASRFSQMKTENDYIEIYKIIKEVADKNHVLLRDDAAW